METNGDSDVQVILKRSARPAQYISYCFTWNNYGDFNAARTLLIDALEKRAKKLVFQAETGENGTPHIQGVVSLKKRARWSEFDLPKGIHWEPCFDLEASLRYCQKLETRNPDFSPYVVGTTREGWKQAILATPLRAWQRSIEVLFMSEPDDRKIYWYCDVNGNNGKTFIAKYMKLKYGDAVTISTCTKSADICTSANETSTMYILNFPRSVADFAPYNAIEQLKDGVICDAKLKKETRCLIVPPAHVIIFANFEPNTEMLSADRWVIVRDF